MSNVEKMHFVPANGDSVESQFEDLAEAPR
jgi:hypothetical protein